MFEAYFSSFTATFIQTASAALLCYYVLRDVLKKSRTAVFWQTLLFVIANSCIFAIFANLFREEYYAPMYFVCLLCGWWYLRRITGENSGWLFLLACMTLNFMYFCTTTSYVIYRIWLPQYSGEVYAYSDIVVLAIPILIFWLPYAMVFRHLYVKLRHLTIPNRWRLSAIPLLFTLALWLQEFFLPSELIGLNATCLIQGFIILCAFITYYQMGAALTNAEKAIREDENLKFLSHQLELQKTRMEDLEAHAEELKRIRHDRRQHVEVLKALLSEGNNEKAREYLEDYEESIRQNIQPPLCENFAADVICRRYEVLARQSDINTNISLSLSKTPGISSSDLAVVLGNLWENAIAAALDSAENKFIKLTAVEKDNKVLIRMENSFGGAIVKEDDKYLSTKAGRNQAVGIGLDSIKTAAVRYGGFAEFTHEDQVFTASVLLCQDKPN